MLTPEDFVHKASFNIHQSVFEGKDCSFLVVIVCEASVF